MKRDMELAREILLAIEKSQTPKGLIPIQISGFTDDDISHHIELLFKSGLIEASDNCTLSRYSWRAKQLTWQGHDFLDAIRDETRWEKAKQHVLALGKIVTVETIKQAVSTLFL